MNATSFLKRIWEDPNTTITLGLFILGTLFVFFSFFILQKDKPYITSRESLYTTPLIIGCIFIFISIMFAIKLLPKMDSKKDKKENICATLAREFPTLDKDTIKCIFHSCNHDVPLKDHIHVYELISINGIVDKDGTYYGMYERSGHIAPNKTSDGLVIHVAASSAGISFGDLHVIAIDLLAKEKLLIEVLEDTYRCKIFKIFFQTPKLSNEPFHIRFMFKWERAMNPFQDFDGITAKDFSYLPKEMHATLQLPGEAVLYEGITISNDGKQISRLKMDRNIDTKKGRFIYKVGLREISPNSTHLLIVYKIDKSSKLLSLRDMIEISQVSESDLNNVYIVEKSIEGNYAATREILYDRMKMFPEGFLVAKLCDMVVGYVETCIWNVQDFTTFEEIKNFPSLFDPKGKYLYIISLCVAEPFRRKGVASKLLESVINLARQKNISEIHLVSKKEIVTLYEKYGFEYVKDLPNFFPGFHGIFMKKRLISI